MTLPKFGPMRGAKIYRNGSESTFRQNNIGTISKSTFHKHIQANAYIYIYIYIQTRADAAQSCIIQTNDATCAYKHTRRAYKHRCHTILSMDVLILLTYYRSYRDTGAREIVYRRECNKVISKGRETLHSHIYQPK
jgi:hypothetical protein